MKKKLIIHSAMLFTALAFGVSSAMALPSAKTVFDGKYPGNIESCNVCHVASPGALTAYGAGYASAGGSLGGLAAAMTAIEGQDADADGFTNLQEINAKSSLLEVAITPFTISTLAPITGSAAALIKQGGAQVALSSAFDPLVDAGYTVPAGKEIMANSKVNITVATATDTVTLLFSAGGVDANAAVYIVDTAANTMTPVQSTTVLNDGAISFVMGTNTTQADIAVERTPPVVSSGGGRDGGTVGGCSINQTSTFDPIMILLLILSMFFLVKRWKFSNL